ncbi:MAG: hypothetical protein ACF8SC_01275 [Phycisphaerales bacterium JB037]
MQQIFKLLAQVGQWVVSNPRHMQKTTQILYSSQQIYRNLSPDTREKVDQLIVEGSKQLALVALDQALNIAESKAASMGLNTTAIGLVRKGIRRAAEVGLEKAIEEIRAS